GYTGDNFAWHGLHQGAVDLWYGPDDTDRRGLLFGQYQAVIDQHVLERGRTARLLQAMVEKPGDKLAVGYDWGTGGVIDETGLARDVAGWYAAIALDGETYGAAANARYVGDDPAILEIHDVAYHVLPAGPFAYDLTARRPVVDGVAQDAPDISGRDFAHLLAAAGSWPAGTRPSPSTARPTARRPTPATWAMTRPSWRSMTWPTTCCPPGLLPMT